MICESLQPPASMTPTWARCGQYLKQNQSAALRWLPLLRDGEVAWQASERALNADGTLTAPKMVSLTIKMQPMDLATISRESWLTVLKQLKNRYPPLAVVGLKAAKRLMQRSPGLACQFDGASGYVSSIGINIEKYLAAERQGWDPADGPVGRQKRPLPEATAATVAPTAAPTALRAPKAHEAPGRRAPPSQVQKLLRTAARCPPLIRYLKSERQFAYMNEAHWRCIRKWCETVDGVAWLKDAGLDPLSFHLHHVKAKETGGHYSVYNCVFAPGSANSWWGAIDSADMREYVGEEACKLSGRHAKWAAVQAARGLDQTAFQPDFA